jgi:predicted kinase
VWNATNLSREVCRQVVRLLASYDARIQIVYVESPAATLFDQNRARERVVPHKVEKLLGRWEVPDLTEAHEVVHVIRPA